MAWGGSVAADCHYVSFSYWQCCRYLGLFKCVVLWLLLILWHLILRLVHSAGRERDSVSQLFHNVGLARKAVPLASPGANIGRWRHLEEKCAATPVNSERSQKMGSHLLCPRISVIIWRFETDLSLTGLLKLC
jgi:hypothetical protein